LEDALSDTPITLKAIDHFGLEVRDLDRAERFYTALFGLAVKRRLPGVIVLDFGGRSFNLLLRPDRVAADLAAIASPTGRTHLAFTVSSADFASAAGRLAAAGVPTHPVIDWGDHDGLYFLDPDGNLLELIDRRDAGVRRGS
jgi:catechol 2,3-dioxygenase-like lactoylglutathione lyase family enzyme